ncbi:unnamed protein product [Brassica oleracea]
MSNSNVLLANLKAGCLVRFWELERWRVNDWDMVLSQLLSKRSSMAVSRLNTFRRHLGEGSV